ncbi:MAG: hypothetical protein QXF12_04775, partial [Candidatus Aenigmatarchaeota archaeon]
MEEKDINNNQINNDQSNNDQSNNDQSNNLSDNNPINLTSTYIKNVYEKFSPVWDSANLGISLNNYLNYIYDPINNKKSFNIVTSNLKKKNPAYVDAVLSIMNDSKLDNNTKRLMIQYISGYENELSEQIKLIENFEREDKKIKNKKIVPPSTPKEINVEKDPKSSINYVVKNKKVNRTLNQLYNNTSDIRKLVKDVKSFKELAETNPESKAAKLYNSNVKFKESIDRIAAIDTNGLFKLNNDIILLKEKKPSEKIDTKALNNVIEKYNTYINEISEGLNGIKEARMVEDPILELNAILQETKEDKYSIKPNLSKTDSKGRYDIISYDASKKVNEAIKKIYEDKRNQNPELYYSFNELFFSDRKKLDKEKLLRSTKLYDKSVLSAIRYAFVRTIDPRTNKYKYQEERNKYYGEWSDVVYNVLKEQFDSHYKERERYYIQSGDIKDENEIKKAATKEALEIISSNYGYSKYSMSYLKHLREKLVLGIINEDNIFSSNVIKNYATSFLYSLGASIFINDSMLEKANVYAPITRAETKKQLFDYYKSIEIIHPNLMPTFYEELKDAVLKSGVQIGIIGGMALSTAVITAATNVAAPAFLANSLRFASNISKISKVVNGVNRMAGATALTRNLLTSTQLAKIAAKTGTTIRGGTIALNTLDKAKRASVISEAAIEVAKDSKLLRAALGERFTYWTSNKILRMFLNTPMFVSALSESYLQANEGINQHKRMIETEALYYSLTKNE